MKHKVLYIIFLLMLLPLGAGAQFISRVLEYTPAPGQHINSSPWGWPGSASSLEGGVNGSLSLGAFGGTVVFRFAEAVENDPANPYGIDFTIFGNPLPDWSEPAVVWVMRDENQNGLPDEQWYELAGSDHYFSSSRKAYRVSYTDPGAAGLDVPWLAEDGSSGIIRANSTHVQAYYPLADSFTHVSSGQYQLEGSLIRGLVDVDSPPMIRSMERAFGYADNRARGQEPWTRPDNPYTAELENSGGDAFDISWALDDSGEPVELARVDFIKVQTAILHEGGYLGEVSTEITGAVDVAPDPSVSGPDELLVLADLPAVIDTGVYQLEAFHFQKGRPVQPGQFDWKLSLDGSQADKMLAYIDQQDRLHIRAEGELELEASLSGSSLDPARITSRVVMGSSATGLYSMEADDDLYPTLYPNPAIRKVRFTETLESELPRDVHIYSLSGKLIMELRGVMPGQIISLEGLESSLYLVQISGYERPLKLVKK